MWTWGEVRLGSHTYGCGHGYAFTTSAGIAGSCNAYNLALALILVLQIAEVKAWNGAWYYMLFSIDA